MRNIKLAWIWNTLPTWMRGILWLLLLLTIVVPVFRYSGPINSKRLNVTALALSVAANLSILPSMFALITFGTASFWGKVLLALGATAAFICELYVAQVGDDYYFLFTERLGSLLTGTLIGLEIAFSLAADMRKKNLETSGFPVARELAFRHDLILGMTLLAIAPFIYCVNAHLHIIIDVFAGAGIGLLYESLETRRATPPKHR